MKEGPKWTDIAIVFLTAVIAVTSYLQWHEIHLGGQDTHDLAVAAKDQVTAIKSQVDQMKQEATDTHDLAVAAKSQAINTQRQAEALKTLAELSKRSFAANRPFVSADHVSSFIDPQGRLNYRAVMFNSGPFAAADFHGHCDVYLDAVLMPATTTAPVSPVTFASGEHFEMCQGAALTKVAEIMAGTAILQIYIQVTYKGPAGDYVYCEKEQYSKDLGQFADLGSCDPAHPFP